MDRNTILAFILCAGVLFGYDVIFVAPKSIDRKFFGFLQLNNEWKIADVTSYL